MSVDPQKSAGTLLGDALSHVSSLVRSEVDLARAEVSENMNSAAVAIGMLAAAVVLAITALNVLSAALVGALTEAGIPGVWSAVIVGLAFGIAAYLFMNKGTNELKMSSLAPTRTAKNVKRDAQTVKEVYNDK
ncbi:phage holin family protein [Heliomarina baculiformis]|uniref:phage holin family protein n=1 Tax=Heliomarina baculiformis TaxID=2872036 RepID=UPI001EE2791A|nr:phage holin family protein [Heliomarina baculiformis]